MGIYANGYEYEKYFNEAARMPVDPVSSRVILVCFYQSGARVRERYETHESYMFSELHESTAKANRTELLPRLLDISSWHEALLHDSIYFLKTTTMPVQALKWKMRKIWLACKE